METLKTRIFHYKPCLVFLKMFCCFVSAPIMRQPRVQPPPRPHSADFLDYEANRRPDQQTLIQSDSPQNQSRRPQRPKSSLDIVNPSDTVANDNYFYSEER